MDKRYGLLAAYQVVAAVAPAAHRGRMNPAALLLLVLFVAAIGGLGLWYEWQRRR